MNFHNTTHVSYLRTVPQLGVRQQLSSRDVYDVPGGLVLWKAVAKTLFFILPIILLAHIFLTSEMNDMQKSLAQVDNERHELTDKNIGLLAQRAKLYAPERISEMAASKLSLYAAVPGQIERVN